MAGAAGVDWGLLAYLTKAGFWLTEAAEETDFVGGGCWLSLGGIS
jgi:hypothetical protein